MAGTCECGAASPCVDVWHAALAEEQADPEMYAWHNPLVCSFLLQHPSHRHERYADTQFRWLQLFLDRGIEALNAVARRTVSRNRGSSPDVVPPELAGYHPLPDVPSPSGFRLSVHHLRGAGGFTAGGAAAYGRRMTELARATVDAWLAAAPSPPR